MIAHDPHLTARLANNDADMLAAQRLRYQVFVQEYGGDGALVDHSAGLETDQFDPASRHLVLVDNRRDAKNLDHVVGVYRLLDSAGARQVGRFYSETSYDLSRLHASGRTLLELGRSCVHTDYRNGPALFMLWNGLADYIMRHKIEILFGVASFHGTDAKEYAAHLAYLHHHHLAGDDLAVTARPEHYLEMNALAPASIDRLAVMRSMPSLIKAYLRIGGLVGQGAFVDRAFNTTDICLVLDTARLKQRHRDLYAGAAAR